VRPVTVAGNTPTAVSGKFGGALQFAGGRLLTPQFAIPLQHRMGAWIRPGESRSAEQFVIGQWKTGSAAGDGAPIAALFYDGAARRIIYYVIDAAGEFVGAATPTGSYDISAPGLHLIEGGVRSTGEVIVGIDGYFFSNGQFTASIDTGDGGTSFSVGDVSNGGAPFDGAIDSPFVFAIPAPNGDYAAPAVAPGAGASTLLLLPLDS
jgi:hypothetical protein